MKFEDMEITPGVIVDVNDPEKLGRVKISAPGLFKGNDPDDKFGVQNTIDNNVLTWIYPMFMNRYQMFSKELTGAKVWVINNKDNYNEFWYIPMFEFIDVTEEVVKDKYDHDIEVIISRKNGDGSSQMYYDRDDGFMIHINDYAWNLMPNGDIICHGEQGDLDIRDGGVHLGRRHEIEERAVMGEKMVELLQQMSECFSGMAEAAKDPHTAPLIPFLRRLATLCAKNQSNSILTHFTFLN